MNDEKKRRTLLSGGIEKAKRLLTDLFVSPPTHTVESCVCACARARGPDKAQIIFTCNSVSPKENKYHFPLLSVYKRPFSLFPFIISNVFRNAYNDIINWFEEKNLTSCPCLSQISRAVGCLTALLLIG
jgi:hypothetical protein